MIKYCCNICNIVVCDKPPPQKCDINCQDKMGLTPIALAAYYRHSNVTAFLVTMGADPFVVDNRGISSAIRIAYSMPVVIRDVFDKLCSEDVLKGKTFLSVSVISRL